jgi:hypothetical protein
MRPTLGTAAEIATLKDVAHRLARAQNVAARRRGVDIVARAGMMPIIVGGFAVFALAGERFVAIDTEAAGDASQSLATVLSTVRATVWFTYCTMVHQFLIIEGGVQFLMVSGGVLLICLLSRGLMKLEVPRNPYFGVLAEIKSTAPGRSGTI